MSQRMAELREDLGSLCAVVPGAEAAQQRIVALAQHLEEEGEIILV